MRVHDLLDQYRTGTRTPAETVERVYDRIDDDETNAWISIRTKSDVLEDVDGLGSPSENPLYGVPFAVKDNIDVAGETTTAACPAYGYEPDESATVVEELVDAGAILIGKTNMDQFASGLVGTRSPHGACRNVHNDEYISGGSSSGSAVAVARGHVAFALGTDTAGSGRVPAAFNGLVGLKPSRGAVSTTGVVPACKTLDCVSIFAQSCRDAVLVEETAATYDATDPYARRERSLSSRGGTSASVDPASLTVAIPEPAGLEFFGDTEAESLFDEAVTRAEQRFGEVIRIDFDVFAETAELLYGGPWVAERLAAVEEFVAEHSEEIHPVVRDILERGAEYSAVETFNAQYQLEALKRRREALFEAEGIDLLITPTTGTTYTISEIREQPIERNSNLGYYTDYVNLLDLSAVSVPVGQFSDGPTFAVTVVGEAGDDRLITRAGRALRSVAPEISP